MLSSRYTFEYFILERRYGSVKKSQHNARSRVFRRVDEKNATNEMGALSRLVTLVIGGRRDSKVPQRGSVKIKK